MQQSVYLTGMRKKCRFHLQELTGLKLGVSNSRQSVILRGLKNSVVLRGVSQSAPGENAFLSLTRCDPGSRDPNKLI